MKFAIKEGSVSGVISDKDGFPVLILDDADGNITIDHKKKNINLNLEIDSEDDIHHILGLDIAK